MSNTQRTNKPTKKQMENRAIWAETFRIAKLGDALCKSGLFDKDGRGCLVGIMFRDEDWNFVPRELYTLSMAYTSTHPMIRRLASDCGIPFDEISNMIEKFDLGERRELQKWLDEKAGYGKA